MEVQALGGGTVRGLERVDVKPLNPPYPTRGKWLPYRRHDVVKTFLPVPGFEPTTAADLGPVLVVTCSTWILSCY